MKLYFTEMRLLSLSNTTRSFSKSQWSTLEGERDKGTERGMEGERERGREGERDGGREQRWQRATDEKKDGEGEREKEELDV